MTNEKNASLQDLTPRELATLVPLVALCFWIGLYPKPFLEYLHKPMGRLAATLQPQKFGVPTAAPAAVAKAEGPSAAH